MPHCALSLSVPDAAVTTIRPVPRAHRAPAFVRRSASWARHLLTPLAAAAALAVAVPAGATDYYWGAGTLSASGLPAGIGINDTLSIGCYLGGCGTTYADQPFLNNGTVYANQTLYFFYDSNVWTNGWQYRLQDDVGLMNAYAGGLFVNEASGSLVKTGGTGTSTISISMQARGGSILDAVTGTIAFTGGYARFDSGAILKANTGTAIAFLGGTASFADGARFLGDGQFNIGTNATFGGAVGATQLAFTNGSYTGGDGSAGSHATLTSDASWSGNGALLGSWVLDNGKTLTVQGGGSRYIQGVLSNRGTINTDGSLYFQYTSHVLDNAGTVNLQGDVGLVNTYAGGTFINTGTLAKTAGTGTSSISGITVFNSGVIDVQTGTLQFSGAGLYFNDGTRFTGAGTALVSSGATFTGSINSANLVLAGAGYQGGDGSAASKATLHGVTTWTGGSLSGQWELAADHTLQVAAGGAKYVQGTVINKGSINAADNLYFQYSSQVLDNQGTLKLQGDVGLVNTYAGGTFINSGTVIKTDGSGISSLASIGVVNTGTIDVRSGTLQLPANFTNDGELKGLGTLAATQILNKGHIAPGASPGTLTLASSLVLDSVGSLDIELHNAALHDLLVVQGNAQLGGTLALSCYALCSLAAGTDIRVLDASGTLSGTFAQVTLQGMATGAFDVVYDSVNSDVYLHVTQNVTAAVPEPQTLALFLGGLAVLGWGARRRRAAAAN